MGSRSSPATSSGMAANRSRAAAMLSGHETRSTPNDVPSADDGDGDSVGLGVADSVGLGVAESVRLGVAVADTSGSADGPADGSSDPQALSRAAAITT